MTIKELIIKLSDYPQHMRVFQLGDIDCREIELTHHREGSDLFSICTGGDSHWDRACKLVVGEKYLAIGGEA
jgi:hypothetical protein